MNVTLNLERRLFVIHAANGYTCHGFDVVYKQLRALQQKLSRYHIDVGIVREEEIGTLAQYEQYRRAVESIGDRNLGTWFDPDTPTKVRRLIECYRKAGSSLRVCYGDAKTGRDWLEENDVIGRVGRSTGVLKVPLLVADNDCGGFPMLDACIVRMLDARSRQEIYRHPSYHHGVMEIREATAGHPYTHGVWVDGQNCANFSSYGKAAHWVAFMDGESMEQPQ